MKNFTQTEFATNLARLMLSVPNRTRMHRHLEQALSLACQEYQLPKDSLVAALSLREGPFQVSEAPRPQRLGSG